MAKKKFSVDVNPDDVMYTNISQSKDGYNSARVVVKKGESEYMVISYEWEGSGVPDFAMSLMEFMKSNASILEEKASEYVEELKNVKDVKISE